MTPRQLDTYYTVRDLFMLMYKLEVLKRSDTIIAALNCVARSNTL